MRTLFRLSKFFVYFFISLQLLKASIEEGWRYQDSLSFCITCGTLESQIDEGFLRSVHTPMAYTVDKAKEIYAKEIYAKKDFQPSTRDKRMFAVFRFTPIIQESLGTPVLLGKTVSISNTAIDEGFPAEVQFSTGYECVFVSGFFKVEEKTKITPDIIKYDARYEGLTATTAKKEVFVRLPPLASSPVPFTFLMRNYTDPEYFRRSLMFRYLGNMSGSILTQGDYSTIRAVHAETEQALENRKRKIEDAFDTAKELAGTTDISMLLESLNELKSDRRNIDNNARVIPVLSK